MSNNVLEGKHSLTSTGAFTLNREFGPNTNNSEYLYGLTEIVYNSILLSRFVFKFLGYKSPVLPVILPISNGMICCVRFPKFYAQIKPSTNTSPEKIEN
jgi:hypothetical protein